MDSNSKQSKVGFKSKKKQRLDILRKSNKNKSKQRVGIKEFYVPEDKFKETLEQIDKEIKWRNDAQRRCSVLVHHISPNIRQSYKTMSFILLEEARLCVLQRDWINLARVLIMAKPSNRKQHTLFFQVFVRYAVICLAHNPDQNLLDIFMQGVASCSGEIEKKLFLKSLIVS